VPRSGPTLKLPHRRAALLFKRKPCDIATFFLRVEALDAKWVIGKSEHEDILASQVRHWSFVTGVSD